MKIRKISYSIAASESDIVSVDPNMLFPQSDVIHGVS
jgi:hypothetical protein